MSNQIGPTVQHVWNVALHVQQNLFWLFHKYNSLPVGPIQPSPILTKELHGQPWLTFQLSGTPEFRGFAMQLRKNSDAELAGEFEWDEDTAENVRYMKCDEDAPKASITQSKSHRRDQITVFFPQKSEFWEIKADLLWPIL